MVILSADAAVTSLIDGRRRGPYPARPGVGMSSLSAFQLSDADGALDLRLNADVEVERTERTSAALMIAVIRDSESAA